MVSTEFEFYVKADLSKYGGKYIAIVGEKVVASGDNAKEVLEEAKKKFPNMIPTLAKIPKEEALILKWK
ncbi:succinyl-CoA synthetase subunit alpha [Candidatus Woesearchaeota archaeon]|nr:succinyl-CoA synthetase subunit alpha [Candidatus Woesearchaeota archaeon]